MANFIANVLGSVSKRKTADAIARATGSSPGASYGGFGMGPVGNWDIDKAVKDGVEKVTWVYRAVDVIATNAAGPPIRSRDGKDQTKGKWIDDSILWNLLNVNANTYEKAWQFRYRLSIILLLSRRGAFVEVVRDAFGRPAQVHLLPPGTCLPIPHPTEFVREFRIQRSDWNQEVIPRFFPDGSERIIWLRIKPHPTDPYAQMTPLMAAGIAAETDYLAHIFNRNFLANDGRPGMLITIGGQLNPVDAQEIKSRFSGGPMRSGEVSVIEADKIDINDMSGNPRDVQWNELLNLSKTELLMAFGVPESIMGNASGRTFDNADAERENFWIDTMVPHTTAIAQGLEALTQSPTDDIVLAYDLSGIDVLQRVERRRREEARSELETGTLTLDEYREITGREPFDVPASRALILPMLGLAIGKDDKDQEKIDKMRLLSSPPEQADPAGQGGGGPFGGGGNGFPQLPPRPMSIQQRAAALGRGREAKTVSTIKVIEGKTDEEPHGAVEDHPYMAERSELEGVVEGVLLGWDTSQANVVADRLNHVKSRKGTRHWDGDQTGELKALNSSYSVEGSRWVDDLRSTLERRLKTSIRREAKKAARDMANMGIVDSIGLGKKGDPITRLLGSPEAVEAHLEDIYQGVIRIVDMAAHRQSQRVAALITKMDQEGKTLRQIELEVRRIVGQRSQWRKTLARNVATSAIESARMGSYAKSGNLLTMTWHTMHDERVRHSHISADGQEVRAGQKFRVGNALLAYPGDVTGPPEEVINCRCWASPSLNKKE